MKKKSLRSSLIKKIVKHVVLKSQPDTPDSAKNQLQEKLNELLNFKTIVSDIILTDENDGVFTGNVIFEIEKNKYSTLDFTVTELFEFEQ